MVEFKSISRLQAKVDRFLQSYADFIEGPAKPTLEGADDVFAGVMRDVGLTLETYARVAREHIVDADFQGLTTGRKDDLLAVAEESEAGIIEIRDATDPERIWAALDSSKKHDAVHRHIIARTDKEKIKARLHLETRKHRAQTPPAVDPVTPEVQPEAKSNPKK